MVGVAMELVKQRPHRYPLSMPCRYHGRRNPCSLEGIVSLKQREIVAFVFCFVYIVEKLSIASTTVLIVLHAVALKRHLSYQQELSLQVAHPSCTGVTNPPSLPPSTPSLHLYFHPHLLSIFTSVHTFPPSLLPSTPSPHLYLHSHLLSIFTSIHTFSPSLPPSTPSFHHYLNPHLLSISSIHTFSPFLPPSTPSLHLYLHPHLLSIITSIHTFSPFPPSTPSLHFYLHPHLLSIFTSIHTFSPRCLLFTRDITSCAELPEVFLLQKTPSSPVTCMATGFYPDLADLFWRKDGEQIFEDVEHGELLPNHDGTFQMSVELKVEVTAEVEGKYECVFQLSGVKEDLVTKLERRSILSNASHEVISGSGEAPPCGQQ
nr:uncharacterized protein LOC133609151 [Nerophis lumbriciformis]